MTDAPNNLISSAKCQSFLIVIIAYSMLLKALFV